jgi:hypothetical protein
VQLHCLEDRVERRGDLGAASRLRAVVILAADDRSSVILPVSYFPRSSTTRGIQRSERKSKFSIAKFVEAKSYASA